MQARTLTIRLVRLAMAASLLFPVCCSPSRPGTAIANISALADERLARSLDVEQEEALKTFNSSTWR